MVSKVLVCLALALLAPASGARGERPATDIQQLGLEDLDPADAIQLTTKWLEQQDRRRLAWAAFWIERDDQFQRVPQLVDIVARYNSSAENPSSSSNWTDYDAALMAVLDALIYLHADVPINEAEALYGKFPVQAPHLAFTIARRYGKASVEDSRQNDQFHRLAGSGRSVSGQAASRLRRQAPQSDRHQRGASPRLPRAIPTQRASPPTLILRKRTFAKPSNTRLGASRRLNCPFRQHEDPGRHEPEPQVGPVSCFLFEVDPIHQ